MSERLLFVCTGNTCRSPMAMALYNMLTGGENACSAGLSVSCPSEAAGNAKAAVEKYGADLKKHLSRQLTADDLVKYSRIITMTASQRDMLRSVLNSEKIITIAQFAGEDADVSDPFGGDLSLYEKTAEMIYGYLKKGLENSCVFAKDTDTADITELEKECFCDAWSENAIRTQIDKKQVIINKENGVLIGYCIFMTAADEGEILRIAVDKSKRRMGAGRKLLDCAIDKMTDRGAEEIFLEVRASNSSARSLYEGAGFIETGVRKNYYRDDNEDAVLYNLKIKER